MNHLQYTPQQVEAIVNEATAAASAATQTYLVNTLKGEDWVPCGFAWVNIHGVKGSTRVGKALMRAGFRKRWGGGGLELWNPSGAALQNVDAKLAGAEAAAKVLMHYGFTAYACSRLD